MYVYILLFIYTYICIDKCMYIDYRLIYSDLMSFSQETTTGIPGICQIPPMIKLTQVHGDADAADPLL